jgi:transcriptional regulator with XRE-family HTH domain
MSDTLSTWVNSELGKRGWSIRELARRADISPSYASRIANGEVTPSADICVSIAKALSIPPGIVFQKAGYLPKTPAGEDDDELQELYMAAKLLDHKGRRQVREYIEFCYQKQIERERTANDGSLPATSDA